jgi:hypothetical protein
MRQLLKLVRKAMPASHAAVVVAGLGRCGTTLIHDAIIHSSIRYRISGTFAVDLERTAFKRSYVYKTHDFPPDHLPADVKVIYMFGNPMDAAVSAFKAFSEQSKHYRHVKSPYSAEHGRMFEKDVMLMEEHFDRWMQRQAFSFLSVRYESIYDQGVARAISEYLGVEITLPPRLARRSSWQDHPDRQKLLATYGSLAAKVSEAPNVRLWHR